MSISAYVGLPGHGKSYGVVENIIIPALEQKRLIFTNIPMVEDEVFKRFGINVIQFDVKDIKSDSDWWSNTFIAGSMFVIDEVPKLWPAGLKANGMRESDRDFLAEHRHLVGDEGFSTEIILVVQNLTMIAAFPRGLIETTFWVVKHIKMGSTKRYRVDVYSGVMSGQSPQLSKREREIQGKFKPEVFALYHSHTKSKTGLAGNETRVDSRFNMFKGASIKIGITLFIVLAIGAFFGLKKVGSYYGQTEEIPESPQIISTIDSSTQLISTPTILKKVGFLSKVDSIVFSHSMRKRLNGFIKNEMFFYIVKDDSETLLSDSDLINLGYKIKTLTECLYHFTNDNYDQYIMCNKEPIDNNFFNNLVSSDSD
jgi:zona occludens toxin